MHPILAAAAFHVVGAMQMRRRVRGVAIHDVVVVTAIQRVRCTSAGDRVFTRAAVQIVFAERFRRRVAEIAGQIIIVVAAEQDVVSRRSPTGYRCQHLPRDGRRRVDTTEL